MKCNSVYKERRTTMKNANAKPNKTQTRKNATILKLKRTIEKHFNKEEIKTQTICMLISYIIGNKLFVLHPISLLCKAIIVLSLVSLWAIATLDREECEDLYQLAYFSPMLIGLILAA
jgi:hypothetical protein